MNIFDKVRRFFGTNEMGVNGIDKQYIIGDLKLTLPIDHALPIYQCQWPLYDRFLPFIVGGLSDEGLIVDIGANVGDTALALAQHCNNKILSIEPDDVFYSYLVSNVRDANLSDRIYTVNCAIGDPGACITLTRTNGTAKPNVNETPKGIMATSLQAVLDKENLSHNRICLLKCDTDGFDYQILFGSSDIIDTCKPFLHWENVVETSDDLNTANRLIDQLKGSGYSAFACFDNFGSLVYTGSDWEFLKKLNGYLWFQRNARQVVVCYCDILAWADADAEVAKMSLAAYRDYAMAPIRGSQREKIDSPHPTFRKPR